MGDEDWGLTVAFMLDGTLSFLQSFGDD